jgi:uncharacterized protein (DUF58 family)
MIRLSYQLYRLGTALTYALARRLTRAGLLALTGMILAGAIGSDVDQSVAFQGFALLVSLLVLAVLWAPFFRGDFRVRRTLPRLATVYQPFRYRVQIANLSERSHRDLELLEELADPRPSFEEFARAMKPSDRLRTFRLAPRSGLGLDSRQALTRPVCVPQLGARETAEAQMEVMPLRRGPLRFRGVAVARRDPFGLFRGFVRVACPETVLVLPKRYPVPRWEVSGPRNYQPGGVALASSIGESEEFVSLRDYRPGDPFRRIHSRSWARAGQPIVKEYQDEFFSRQALVLDTFAGPADLELFEEAVAVAASFACTVETQESLLDLLFAGCRAYRFTAGRGLGQSGQMLEILASVQPSLDGEFALLSQLVIQHAPVLSACVCIFVDWDEPRRELVRQLRAAGLPVLVLVIASPAAKILERMPEDGNVAKPRVLRAGSIAEDLRALESFTA